MHKLEKYSSYKDSGVEWLGEVPEHWEVKRLKYIMLLQNEKITIKNEKVIALENLESSTGQFIKTNSIYNGEGIKFKQNYVLFGKLRPYLAKVYHCDSDGIAFGDLLVYKPKNVISKFGYYYVISSSFIKTVDSSTYGTKMPRASSNFIGTLLFPLPPKEEQTKIANFLDKKTAQIDEAIKQKEELISLLKERRQVLIHKAVTQGLDTTVKMKDSGVAWIGEIPEHWEVKKIKYLGKFINGYAFNSEEFVEEGIRVMKISNIQTMKTDWTDASYISEKYYYKLKQFRVNENDLVFALTRPIISTGIKATIIKDTEKILLNQRNTMLKPNNVVLTKWLYFIILDNYFIQIFDNLIDKTGQQPNISTKDIENIEMSLPNKKEQKNIVEYIEIQTQKIDKAIYLQEKQIEKIKEYKATLIDSLVTGKVRVV